ncbi:30S ribosomal protein S8, partial [Bacillus altitudinis]|uniref:30S ribosomal protein S8 n=1 Tax=Bacillus altitudinis TaxID=293387 RepID=UPI0011A239A9
YHQNNQRLITPLKTITKPPLHVYPKSNQLPPLLNPLPIPIISTSQPLLSHKQPPPKQPPPQLLAYLS